jgi:hypothetical protein
VSQLQKDVGKRQGGGGHNVSVNIWVLLITNVPGYAVPLAAINFQILVEYETDPTDAEAVALVTFACRVHVLRPGL